MGPLDEDEDVTVKVLTTGEGSQGRELGVSSLQGPWAADRIIKSPAWACGVRLPALPPSQGAAGPGVESQPLWRPDLLTCLTGP